MPCRHRPSCQVAPQFGEGEGETGRPDESRVTRQHSWGVTWAELKIKKKVPVKNKSEEGLFGYNIGPAYTGKVAGKGKRPENILGHFCLHYRDLHHIWQNRKYSPLAQACSNKVLLLEYFRVSLLYWSICFFGNFHSTTFQCWMSTTFFLKAVGTRCFQTNCLFSVSWSSSPCESGGVGAACRFCDEAR